MAVLVALRGARRPPRPAPPSMWAMRLWPERGAVLHHRHRARPVVVGDAVERGRARPRGRPAPRDLLAGRDDHAGSRRGAPARMSPSTRSWSSVSMASSSCGGIAVAGVEQDLVAGARRLVLDPLHHVGEEGVVEVRDHHAQEARAALHETAGHGVRPIAELRPRPWHGLPGAAALTWRPPRMTRETRRLGNAGASGDVGDRRLARLDLGSHLERSTRRRRTLRQISPARKAGPPGYKIPP